MPNPKISIIIPAYQHGRELPKCLDSILTQTLRDFEVIVANDGSIDNTAMVLEKYKLDFSYANLKLTVVNQINQGANSARNNGARKATGEYMLFCDADVVMVPMMLEKMLKALIDNPDKSYVYSSFYFDAHASRCHYLPFVLY